MLSRRGAQRQEAGSLGEFYACTAMELYRQRQAVEETKRRRPSSAPPVGSCTARAVRAASQQRLARQRQAAEAANAASLANVRWTSQSRRVELKRGVSRLDKELERRQRKIEHERAFGQAPTRAQTRQYRRAAERRREQEEMLADVYLRTMKPKVLGGRAGRLLRQRQEAALLGGAGGSSAGAGGSAAGHALQEAFRAVWDRRDDNARSKDPMLDRHVIDGRRAVTKDPLQVAIALERRGVKTKYFFVGWCDDELHGSLHVGPYAYNDT